METTLLFMDQLLSSAPIRDHLPGRQPRAVLRASCQPRWLRQPADQRRWWMWRRIAAKFGGSFGVDLNRTMPPALAALARRAAEPDTYWARRPSEPGPRHSGPSRAPGLRAGDVDRTYDVLLRPWGYQNGHPPNRATYDRVGAIATAVNEGSMVRRRCCSTWRRATLDHHHTAHGSLAGPRSSARAAKAASGPTRPTRWRSPTPACSA